MYTKIDYTQILIKIPEQEKQKPKSRNRYYPVIQRNKSLPLAYSKRVIRIMNPTY